MAAVSHWNCASSLCNNSWRTKNIPGLTFYSLRKVSSDERLKREYSKILKNDNINWKKARICSEHWSIGRRESIEDIPDVVCTKQYLQKINNSNSLRNKSKKLVSANFAINHTKKRNKRRKLQRDLLPDMTANIETETEKELRLLLKSKDKKIEELESQLNTLLKEKNVDSRTIYDMKKGYFTYGNLKTQPQKCFKLTGVTIEEFDCLFECVKPYVNLIIYPDRKENSFHGNRKLDVKTELMVFLTVCRHSLHLSVMGWMTKSSESTISRIFVGWAVFLSSLFDFLDLSPLPGFVDAFMPKVFCDSGFQDVEVLGDATESWIAQSENFEVNNITFSNYKNHTTGKTSVWIYPHGGLLCCSDTYPGTISDKDLTEMSGVLNVINKGKVVLTDKGFDIADACHNHGVLHNRPPMKFNDQYDQAEVSANFDIATLRIYNENYIGRMRDWAILNSCWPMTRIDLLGYCFKIFAHLVNILKKPVGPKSESLEPK